MWDFKLLISNFLYKVYILIYNIFFNLYDTVTIYSFHGFSLFNVKYLFVFNSSAIFGLKFLIVIAFLILIRGGTPRYRYDYLTKLGWLKFIGLLILFFFFALLTFYVY